MPVPNLKETGQGPERVLGHGGVAGAENRYLTSLFDRRQKIIYVGLVAVWALSVLWFWRWWLDPTHFVGWLPLIFATIPLLWLHGLQLFFVYVLMHASRSAAPDPVPGQWRVAMIVTKTPSEPFEVVRKTLTAMLEQDYPHDTWLADEDASEETTAWCKAHGVRISCRKGVAEYHRTVWPRRTRCKEGNLSYFYDHWGYENYDIVAQLDADHVPAPGYLREMIRPFADPKVGYVTAPSICASNAGESWAARSRLHTEAAFHGVFQTGYTRAFSSMCIGSHYSVRTKALKEIGGLGPDLAEDHSTTLLMNAGGWRGVHAIDAVALGDGPATVADLATQEFQWSRSLVTLLLQHTRRYLGRLPFRLKFLFIFCQMWYPLYALTSVMLFVAPVVAIAFDMRFANVTYPSFVAHAVPATIVMTVIAFRIKRDGFFRPFDAPVLSWEKALFLALQWPWILWGCVMAVRDKLTGKFIDFRITPKGDAAIKALPTKVLLVYTLLALAATMPVLFSEDLVNSRGFLLLALLNAVLYAALVLVITGHHLSGSQVLSKQPFGKTIFQLAASLAVVVSVGLGFSWRGVESIHALAFGLEPFRLVRTEYGIAGAGYQAKQRVKFIWDPGWMSRPITVAQ